MKTRRKERGFTIIEVIVASFILMIGVTMISSIVTTVVKKNFLSLRHTQAVNLAQNKVEELLNDGYQSPNLAEGSYENPNNPINETGDESGVFTQSWQIEDVYPIQRAKFITSHVEWQDADGQTQSVYLTGVCIDESN